MESRQQRAVPDFAALESGIPTQRIEGPSLVEEDAASDHRSSVKDHFYDDAQVLQDIQRDEMLEGDRASLQITKTLSFNDFDDPHQLDLVNGVDEDRDDLCSNFVQPDRNSSDETITESQLEEQSNYSLSMPNDIDVFLTPPEFRKLDSEGAPSNQFFRHSPVTSPEDTHTLANENLHDEPDDAMDGSESYWEHNAGGKMWQVPYLDDSVTLNDDFTQTEHYSNDAEEAEKLPLISREGQRKNRTSRRGGYQQNRVRKNNNQVDYLRRIYAETGGKLDRKQRKRVVKQTGLTWIQIYKWIFDMQVKDASKSAALATNTLPFQIFRVIDKNGNEIGKPLPIFKVEKMQRCSCQ